MPQVSIINVQKSFTDQRNAEVAALRDFSLCVPDGAFTVLTGPSGSGKTTLLRLIAGLEQADSGKVLIDGTATGRGSGEPACAFVFQEPVLYSHLSVRDNLLFPLLIRKAPGKVLDEKAEELESLLNLQGLLNRQPETLSGGQKQRVALGRALASTARLLLLDEPFSSLDPSGRVELRSELVAVHHKLNLTTIYVTHDQAEALSLADQLCVLEKGGLQQQGSAVEIYNNPASLFVAKFFGAAPINLWDAELRDDQRKGMILSMGSVQLKLPDDLPQKQLLLKNSKKLIVGVRPESLVAHPEGFPVQLHSKEFLGDRSLCTWMSPLGLVRTYLDAAAPQPGGETHQLSIRGNVHVFDRANGGHMASFRHEQC